MSNPLNYGPRLHAFAYGRIEDDCRLNVLEGSVRSGKTWSLIPKIIRGCKYNVGGWRLFTGVSKQTIFNNILNDLLNLIGPKHYSYNRQSGILNLLGSTWLVMGAKDEGSEKYVRGMTCGFVIADEVTLMPKEFFDMLTTRMSPPGARLYATTNCDTPKHWLKTDVLDNERLKSEGRLFSMHCTMDDNPNLTDDYKSTVRAMYKGLFFERYILGRWVMAEGAIYRDAWSDDLLFDDASTPVGLFGAGGYKDRWISVDCGVDHPQVYLEYYDDGSTIWVTRRYCWDSRKEMQQKTDGQYADDLVKFMGPNTGCQILVPPEAASFKAELTMRGLWVNDANNEVLEGIQTVSALMAQKKLRIHRVNCAGLVKAIELYAWDPKAALRGIEQPLKQDDDDADSLRYGVHEKVPRYRFS